MCEGCGACTASCRVRSIDVLGFDDEQVFAQLAALGSAPVATSPGVPAYAGAGASP
jgi:heterodisulfide reductase subunit C